MISNQRTPTLSSSNTALIAAIATAPDGESTTARDGQRSAVQSRCRRRHHRDETQAVAPPYGFAVNFLCSSQHPLCSIDVQFNTEPIFTLAFSSDGSFLVSVGIDTWERLWKIDEILVGNADSRPVQMETQHGDNGVFCVAVSPNNRSIFSGGARGKTVLIHDIET